MSAVSTQEEGVPPAVAVESAPGPQPEPEPEPEVPRPPPGLESSEVAGARRTILDELLAMGKAHMDGFSTFKIMAEDPKFGLGHQARKTYLPGTQLPVTCVQLRAEGFTMEHVASFYGDFNNTFPLMVPEMKLTALCVDEGAATRWLRMKPPNPLSPRTLVTSSYKIWHGDGSFTWLVSSKGNEAIYAAEVAAGRIKKKDVRATVHIDFNHFVPSADGSYMTCTKIMCMDVGGSVPDIAKKKMAARQIPGHKGLIDWCLTGKTPDT